jgi:exopolysaccharide biosynthesis polyprenyl glycosylphosphotransferase
VIRRHGNALRTLLMAADAAMAALLGLIIYQAAAHPAAPLSAFLEAFWVRSLLYGALWVALLYLAGAYRLRAHWTLMGEARTVVRATFWLAVVGISTLFVAGEELSDRTYVLLLFPATGIAGILTRSGLRVVFMYLRRNGRNVRNLIILGTGDDAVSFARMIQDHSVLGVRVVGYLGDRRPLGEPEKMYRGRVFELPRLLREEVIDEIAVCVRPTEWRLVEEFVNLAHEEGKMVRVPISVPHLDSSQRFVEDLGGTAVLSYASGPDELASNVVKRIFDLGLAITAIVLTAPIMLAIAGALRWKQGPGVVFTQTRVGMHGRPFTIYKFRTMELDAEERYAELAERSSTQGAAFKMVDDPRITPLGRLLRRWSLDELPQFFNVLRGEMSVVGPRPAPPREVEGYDLWHHRRLSMKPGITGLWQITARLDRDFDQRAELDLSYIDRWSIWLDLAILFRTIPAIIRRPGH